MSEMPDLSGLARNESAAWDPLFEWLYPTAFAAAESKLGEILPQEVEDVAIEAIEILMGKLGDNPSVGDLRPLVCVIARDKAVDRLRMHFSKKRGEGKLDSLDDHLGDDGAAGTPHSQNQPETDIHQKEMAHFIRALTEKLNPKIRDLLSDFFLHGRKYDELAAAHGIAKNSVGVYLKRGLDGIREELAQQPKLAGELRTLIGLPSRLISLLLSFV